MLKAYTPHVLTSLKAFSCGTDQFEDVQLQCCVVALFRVIEMDEEEDVGPDVMLVVDMLFKTLKHQQKRPYYRLAVQNSKDGPGWLIALKCNIIW